MLSTKIILIGFMGSGKSSVGRFIAKKSQSYFLDTDAMIESAEGEPISTIFELKGEAYFRSLELNTVRWLKENVKSAVISTGGGMLASCAELKELGTIVYLKVPFETIVKRMTPSELKKRPLFENLEHAKALYDERHCMYEKSADIIIDADRCLEEVFKAYEKAINETTSKSLF